MTGWQYPHLSRITKQMRLHQGWYLIVQMGHLRKPAAKNYPLRIEDIDDHGQPARQSGSMPIQGLPLFGMALCRPRGNVFSAIVLSGAAFVIL